MSDKGQLTQQFHVETSYACGFGSCLRAFTPSVKPTLCSDQDRLIGRQLFCKSCSRHFLFLVILIEMLTPNTRYSVS